MKKVFYGIIILSIIIFIKFFISPYKINYNIDEFNITETALKNNMYFEIDYKDQVYNFMFYNGRKLFKKRIKSVEIEEKNGLLCLTPNIKGYEGYQICKGENELVSPLVINESKENIEFKEDFLYKNNLNDNEFVLIWKYDGFYYINGNSKKSINIFSKDRYSNDLMFKVDKYLIFPNYSGDYQFSSFLILDMTTGKYETIKSDYEINYDCYVVGTRKNKYVYIFDNKNNKLYEINYKKGNVKLIGDEIKGFFKYEKNRKIKVDITEYTKNKITFFKEEEQKYLNISNNYLSYDLNKDLKTKYFYDDNITVVDNYNENIYFLYKDNLYRYNNNGYSLFAHYFEFNFNKNTLVFVYNK